MEINRFEIKFIETPLGQFEIGTLYDRKECREYEFVITGTYFKSPVITVINADDDRDVFDSHYDDLYQYQKEIFSEIENEFNKKKLGSEISVIAEKIHTLDKKKHRVKTFICCDYCIKELRSRGERITIVDDRVDEDCECAFCLEIQDASELHVCI